MKKQQYKKPLTNRLRVLLTLIYFLAGASIIGAGFSVYYLGLDSLDFGNTANTSMYYFLIMNLITIGLYGWVIYNFHARKKFTVISYAVAEIINLNIAGGSTVFTFFASVTNLQYSWVLFASPILSAFISTGIILFLYFDKEATKHLNK